MTEYPYYGQNAEDYYHYRLEILVDTLRTKETPYFEERIKLDIQCVEDAVFQAKNKTI